MATPQNKNKKAIPNVWEVKGGSGIWGQPRQHGRIVDMAGGKSEGFSPWEYYNNFSELKMGQDGSGGKVLAVWAQWLEFNLRNPRKMLFWLLHVQPHASIIIHAHLYKMMPTTYHPAIIHSKELKKDLKEVFHTRVLSGIIYIYLGTNNPNVYQWVNDNMHIHTVKGYSASKSKEILSYNTCEPWEHPAKWNKRISNWKYFLWIHVHEVSKQPNSPNKTQNSSYERVARRVVEEKGVA